MRKIRVAIIGLGRIGLLHARFLDEQIDEAALVAVAEPHLSSIAHSWLKERRTIRVYQSVEQLLAQKDVEAVLICSASNTHAQFIEAAARAQKHVFCEKPLGLNIERIQQVLKTVEETGIKLQLGFQRRFDAHFKAVQQGICAGKIGEPHFLRLCSRDPDFPPFDTIKATGGLFFDMMIHDFDMARFLFGEIRRVEARATVLIEPCIRSDYDDVDTAVVILHFENGALGVIDNSRRAAYGYDQRAEAFGSQGMLVSTNSFPHSVQHWNNVQLSSAKPHYFFTERYEQAYKDEMVSFIEAVSQNKSVAVSGYDGLRAVELGHQALLSHKQSQENKEPV